MLRGTSHTRKDNKKLLLLNRDIANVLAIHPGLTVSYKGDMPVSLKGQYNLRDDTGGLQGSWEIKIPIPTNYPNAFPLLIETGGKIDREDPDAHIDSTGVCCTELTINERGIARDGISLEAFIEKYVQRYFSWHLLKESGYSTLDSWGHKEQGLREFFYIALCTKDHAFIFQALELIRTNKLPARNKPCFCGDGKRYKLCHQIQVKELLLHWPEILDYQKLFA